LPQILVANGAREEKRCLPPPNHQSIFLRYGPGVLRYKSQLEVTSAGGTHRKCSVGEISLNQAIKYSPGSEQFDIIKPQELNPKQKNALEFIKKDIMGEYMRTGVQFAINIAVFKLLKMNSVYPVANEEKLSDKKGRVLPDLILMKDGSTVTDLANEIHSDLQKGLLYAKDLRYNLRLPLDYQLRDRDVISLVSASKK